MKLTRRKAALKRLEAQLASGVKPLESARLQAGPQVMQPLTEHDIKRIKKEINTLKERI